MKRIIMTFAVFGMLVGLLQAGSKKKPKPPRKKKQVQKNIIAPDDISFCIADLKFQDKDHIKILELGDGAISAYNGYDALTRSGSMWNLFWTYLNQFKLPMWCIGQRCNAAGSKVMLHFGGRFANSTDRLRTKMIGAVEKLFGSKDRKHLESYRAVVVVRVGPMSILVKNLQKQFPNVIFVSTNSRKHACNKYFTNLLFEDDDLKSLRPACGVFSKKYKSGLAQEIFEKIPSDTYVIKPISASRGRGVLFVRKEKLDKTLKRILEDRHTLHGKNVHESLQYWRRDRSKLFIVEEYVPSKSIEVLGNLYDATMRVVFALHTIDGVPQVTMLDGYWKLPSKPLGASGTLLQKHRSNLHSGNAVQSARVDEADMKVLSQALEKPLEKIYAKMLLTRGMLDKLDC